MCIRTRIEELTTAKSVRNIEQLPVDIKSFVNNLKAKFKKEFDYVPKLSECLYLLGNNLISPPTCKHPECKKLAKYGSSVKEYKYCSRSCSDTDPGRNTRIQEKRLPQINYHEVVKKSNATRTANGSWSKIMAGAIVTRTANGWHEINKKAMQDKSPGTIRKQVEARKNTNIERYGSVHSGGVGRSKLKTLFICGVEYKNIQGYEDILIYELLQRGISVDDIEPCSRFYKHSFEYQIGGVTHRYHPDIYVVSEDKYYEAKSEYWYTTEKEIIDIKSKAVTKSFEMRIYDAKYAKEIRQRIVESNSATQI